MFGLLDVSSLDNLHYIMLLICIFAVFIFEFINGFHDTANAVATVIYTKTLKPIVAVVWSGIWNFLGVLSVLGFFFAAIGLGDIFGWLFGTDTTKVAMGIVKLVPLSDMLQQDLGESVAAALAILLAAIAWNLGTWYFGIPCSSSHTLIGSLLGTGLAFTWMHGGSGVNWSKAGEIGTSLLLSPLFGFSLAIILMFILKSTIKNKVIFKEPDPENPPPRWVRVILIVTCTLVSYFHGSNDGQKGVGLLMVILMAFLPLQLALSPEFKPEKTVAHLEVIEQQMKNHANNSMADKEVNKAAETVTALKADLKNFNGSKEEKLNIRKRIEVLDKTLKPMIEDPEIFTPAAADAIKSEMKGVKKATDYALYWTLIMISIALGLGTMVGWKRIVVTIGEKIGKTHLTYAQGASAELVAAFTIGLSTAYGLPVSTTQVLSSGIAGTMVAQKGVKNLQKSTVSNIFLAWVLTFPVTVTLSAVLFLFFTWIF
jgi:inorganic phosphate transporter, PiT family